jgi:MFS family permease
VPFFLYLMPVLTGALADRYGYKRMFIIAYLVMIVSYYSQGLFTSLPGFFMASVFLLCSEYALPKDQATSLVEE